LVRDSCEEKVRSSPRTNPAPSRSSPAPTCPPAPPCPAPAPPGPIRTHTPAPLSAPTLAPVAAAYFIYPPDLSSHRHPRWNVAKCHEINVFDSFECKTTIPAAAVPPGEQVFDYLWRCDYKPDRGNGTPPTRARFCIVSDREWNKANDVPTSPVSSHRAVRATIAVAFILGWGVHTKDSLRAYLQSECLPKPVYVNAPPEADEPPSSVWAFSRPTYGKGNAGRHLHFLTQSKFLPITGIALSSAFDTVYCVPRRGSISSYVDDTSAAADPPFKTSVQTILKNYKTHTPDLGIIMFAGITATADADGMHCRGSPDIGALLPLDGPTPMTTPLSDPAALHSLAAQVLWVCRVARPDVLTSATHLVNCKDPTSFDALRANDTFTILTNRKVSLHFPRLDLASLRLSVYADYSGSTLSPVHMRQVGYLVLLTNDSHRCSLLHWASHRPHRVCRGSTAGELLALADAVAASLDVRQLLQELFSVRVPLDENTDSATAYELVTSFKDPADMSGKNDHYMLRRALLSGTIYEVNHVHGHHNSADALSKPTLARPPPNASLADELRTGRHHTAVVAHSTTAGYHDTPCPGVTFS